MAAHAGEYDVPAARHKVVFFRRRGRREMEAAARGIAGFRSVVRRKSFQSRRQPEVLYRCAGTECERDKKMRAEKSYAGVHNRKSIVVSISSMGAFNLAEIWGFARFQKSELLGTRLRDLQDLIDQAQQMLATR